MQTIRGPRCRGRGDERQPGILKAAVNEGGLENGSDRDSWGRLQGG